MNKDPSRALTVSFFIQKCPPVEIGMGLIDWLVMIILWVMSNWIGMHLYQLCSNVGLEALQ